MPGVLPPFLGGIVLQWLERYANQMGDCAAHYVKSGSYERNSRVYRRRIVRKMLEILRKVHVDSTQTSIRSWMSILNDG